MPAVRPRFAARGAGDEPAGSVLATAPEEATAVLEDDVVVSTSSRWRFDARVRRLADVVDVALPDAAAEPVPARAGRLLVGTPVSVIVEAEGTDGALRVRWCVLDAPCG